MTLPDLFSSLAGEMRRSTGSVSLPASAGAGNCIGSRGHGRLRCGQAVRRRKSRPETGHGGFEDGTRLRYFGADDGGGNGRAADGREAEPNRSKVLHINFWTQNRGLYANNRITIHNHDPIQGSFCIYSDRD